MADGPLRSSLCTEASLTSDRFVRWAERIRPAWDHAGSGLPVLIHRKLWEWLFIIEALSERGMLLPGRRGLGFGVGNDPLPSLFASLGCEIVATDLDVAQATEAGWVAGGQHAAALADLNRAGLCDPDQFAQRVSFRPVDMNRIPDGLRGFDFTWSACAFEHLGSIERGQEFLLRQMSCLRPGGVAVHTTEFNVSSDRSTVTWGPTVLFRRRDVDWIARHLRRGGDRLDVDFDTGSSVADRHVDVPPYTNVHLKTMVSSYVTTSLALVIEKNPDRPAERSVAPWRQARLRGSDVWHDRLGPQWRRMVSKWRTEPRR